MACAKPSDCAPCNKCPESPPPVLPRCDIALPDGVFTNATVVVEGGCITIVQTGTPFLYQPDSSCAGEGGGGDSGGPVQGDPGPSGAAATISIVSVTSLPPGAAPTVTNVGTPTNAQLVFGIPRGEPGSDAQLPTDGASSTEAGILLQDGIIKTPLPVLWPPVMNLNLEPPVGAGVMWQAVKQPDGTVKMTLDLSTLISTFQNQITILNDRADAQDLAIADLVARVTALEAGP